MNETTVSADNIFGARYLRHPYIAYTLREAIQLARGTRELRLQPPPASLQEAREIIADLVRTSAFNWITGQAALDLLDAAIDGRDLAANSRLVPSTTPP
jgi:hypothetical protein